MKNFLNGKICSIFVIIRKIQKFLMTLIMKNEMGGVIIVEFIGLKSKMYAIKKMMVEKQILQKEYALRQNLMNLKMFFLIKKLLDIK